MSILLDNGKIKDISNNFLSGAGIRVLDKNSWGFFAQDKFDVSEKDLEAAKKLAKSNKSKGEAIRLAEIEKPKLQNLPKIKISPDDIPLEDKIEFLKEIEKNAKIEGIKSTSVVYFESKFNLIYSNSEGLESEYSLNRIGFAITSVAMSEGVYQIGSERRYGIAGYEFFKKSDAFELAQKSSNTAIELLSASTPKPGTYPVILDQELAGVFIHEAVGHALEADHVIEGNSILKGKMNEKIASSLVTVYDDPSIHEFGYYPFDDEGANSRKTTLIKNGVLCSYLNSRETAAKLGGECRNSRAQGYSSRQVIRMSNTFIDNGDMKFDEMLSELKNGIYLIGSRGGQVNPGEGVFQFNAEKGFIIENGEITKPLRDVSLSGKTLEIMNNISGVGNDLKMNSGNCGKAGQVVAVGDGSPHILVSNAMVGGSG